MGSSLDNCSETPNFSGPANFDLTKDKINKTVDIGLNGTALSSDPLGGILQLSTYHPEHGIIVAAPYDQFDGSRYYEPAYVRQYRTRMLQMLKDGQRGFGLQIHGTAPEHVAINLVSMNAAIIELRLESGALVSYSLTVDADGTISQQANISNPSKRPVEITYTVDLNISVHRASYGQLTEGGPLPIPPCENHFQPQDEGLFSITNPFLPAHVEGILDIDGSVMSLDDMSASIHKGVVEGHSSVQKMTIASDSEAKLRMRFLLVPGLFSKTQLQGFVSTEPAHELASSWLNSDNCVTYMIRRNVDYILGCCAIPVSGRDVCIITDHVALPLGWNRDNYWQWRLLLFARRHINRLVKQENQTHYVKVLDDTIKGHLNWVFRKAQRPNKFWHRSYLVTGKPKDGGVFQLDQQCYPLLELCDYLEEYPEEQRFVDELLATHAITDILDLFQSKQDPATGLYPTDETPGDDAVEFPFHFSSHVLLWYTLKRIANLCRIVKAAPGYSVEDLESLAENIQSTAKKAFISSSEEAGKSRIAYLTDGHGQHTFYHDANDIPTVFATKWGFFTTPAEIKTWRKTMDFALTAENEAGYSRGGPFEGLGSVHSKGPWPLGYFQELMYAHMIGKREAARDVSRRIIGAMQWDGTFGEAVDVNSGQTTSKAWFSWPGSMLGALLIEYDIKLDC